MEAIPIQPYRVPVPVKRSRAPHKEYFTEIEKLYGTGTVLFPTKLLTGTLRLSVMVR
jgi:hypothetical protein